MAPQRNEADLFARLYDLEEEKRKRMAGTEMKSAGDILTATLGTQSTQTSTSATHLGTQPMGSTDTSPTHATQSTLGTQSTHANQLPAKRYKDTRDQLNLKLPQGLLESFKRWCFENKVSQRDAVVAGIELIMGRKGSLGTQSTLGSLGSFLPNSDDDIDDDDQAIIALYEHVTGNAWRDVDRDCLNQNRHLGKQCILCAVALGRDRYKSKINSFKFFEGNIREVSGWVPDKIAKELSFRLQSLKRRGIYRP